MAVAEKPQEKKAAGPALRVDPITYEILRHRLWSINAEAGNTLERVSGSLIASEVHDMNASIMTARGDSLVIAPYISVHAISMETLAKEVLATCMENPGVGPGDMFLSNDPFVGAQHQMDVVVLGAVHFEGELIGWVGSTIHQIDIGGPVPGQVQVGAKDIYGEQPLFPPMKIVEGGRLREDLVRVYTRMSRVAHMVRLDLTAKIASNNVAVQRIQELCRTYGVDTVKKVMEDMLDQTEARIRARLRELPDGTWRHRSYLEYDDKIYQAVLAMTKKDDKLIFDFRGSSPQAPAVINNPIHATVSDVYSCVMTYLCWDMPWVPAGVGRAIEVISDPGTIVHVKWPGGVSKATTSTTQAVINLADNALGKLLAASDTHRERSMANWVGSLTTEELFGTDQRGQWFGATVLDTYFGGGGARSRKDGVDTGGYVGSIYELAPNAEAYEFAYPILYLFRRHQSDSGGDGMWRGGAGCTLSYVVHDTERIPTKIMHTSGSEWPESVGICGGGPSQTNQFIIRRKTDVRSRFTKGEVPQELGELSGEWDIQKVIAVSYLDHDDVYQVRTQAGGGYGDPLDRDPARVLEDVRSGVVSADGARKQYGVVIDAKTETVDHAATDSARQAVRKARKERSKPVTPAATASGTKADGAKAGPAVNEFLRVVQRDGTPLVRCQCGHVLGDARKNFKEFTLMEEGLVKEAGPYVNQFDVNDRFVYRRFYCPSCLRRLETEVCLKDEPVLHDVEIAL
jgi:N-methylhydantoinase B